MNDQEPTSNIGLVCDEHAPKPGLFKNFPAEYFIGLHVKLGFPSKEGPLEHMWVKVEWYDEATCELKGKLDNDPVYDVGYQCNDDLAFEVDEIEAVHEGPPYQEIDLKKVHTRQLISWLRKARATGGWYTPGDHKDPHARGATIEQLKAELATREHIPNKKESKEQRQEAAKRPQKKVLKYKR